MGVAEGRRFSNFNTYDRVSLLSELNKLLTLGPALAATALEINLRNFPRHEHIR